MNFYIRIYIVLGVVFSWMSAVDVNAQLYINEILAANNSTNYDTHYYNFSDWIEIFNDGDHSVNLEGYTLSDDINIPDKYRINFSLRVSSSSHVVIWADKESWYSHANFSLDSDGEFIALFDPGGTLIDSFSFDKQLADVSYGRYPDGSNEFVYMPEPTCSKANKAGVYNAGHVSDSVIFSQVGGLYSGQQSIELSSLSPTASIRYTLDGSWPDSESDLYNSPLSITRNKVVRARSFDPGLLPGPVSTESFLIDQESSLPVLSISTNPDYFFNYGIGIFVVGTNGIKGNCIDSAVNFNRPWERAINFEYFTPDGVSRVNQVLGTRIAGRCSRTRPMKPLAFYSRDKYGKEGIDGYQFFNSKDLNSPKTLYLRNSGTEAYSTYLRDGFMQTLIMDRMDMDYQAYQPVVLYINGKYYGLYNLREKMDEHYVASNYGIDPESIDLLEYNTIGTRDLHQGDWLLYDQFLDYVSNKDLSIPENYEYVKSQMDVDEFMNIHIANIYFENEDWPNNNNKFWRERSPGGKWRWYMYDLDFGFGYWPKTGNSVKWFFDNREDSKIAYKLKMNPDFKNEFVQRMASHLNTTFQTDRVLHVLDSVKGNIENDMQKHIDLWGNPWSISKWERNVEVMVDFTHGRTAVVLPQIMEEFDLSGTFTLDLENLSAGRGRIELAGVDIPDDFTGIYFEDVPLRMRAIPENGYKFSGWSGDIVSTSEEIYYTADSDKSVSAHFETVEAITNLYINEFKSSNLRGLTDEFREADDWIEIYNDNDYSIDLAGLYISDSAGWLEQYQFPYGDSEATTIAAKGYILLWADNDVQQGSLHLPFKLSKSGDMIFLSQQRGLEIQIMDSIRYEKQHSDVSYGRRPLDEEQWVFLEPSPGEVNIEKRLENVFINEFMASNRSVLQNEDGNWGDWIEIYNANDYPVDIAGMFISDDILNPQKYCIPYGCSDTSIIPTGGYLILWAENSSSLGILHLDFALSGSGEQIVLTQPGGMGIMDSVSYPGLIADAPYGRSIDGEGHFSYLLGTPGFSNEQPSFKGLCINEIMVSNRSVLEDGDREYDDWIELYNDSDSPVNVGGLFLSDQMEDGSKFRISTAYPDSTTIAPGGHLLIWADDSTEQGILHASFKLSNKGEQVLLSSTTGEEIIDSLSYGKQYSDVSYGRNPKAPHQWIFLKPSPEEENTEKRLENVFINEFMASNRSVLQDRDGNWDDWIEIFNANEYPVDIGGMFISDDLENKTKYRIPVSSGDSTSIPAGGYLVLWADDSTQQGILHLNFSLSGDGEQILLTQPNGVEMMDSICYPDLIADAPYGRSRDGAGHFSYLLGTPGASNAQPSFEGLYINEVLASNRAVLEDGEGEYDDWIELYNDSDFPVNVGGLFLSDQLEDRSMFRISSAYPDSTTIAPKGHLLIWADDSAAQGILHAPFKLSANGEQVILSSPTTEIILDSLSFGQQYQDLSFGRISDGAEARARQMPTPRAANHSFSYDGIRINEVMASEHNLYQDEHGDYGDWIELYNSSDRAIDIAGMLLSDSLGQVGEYFIPGANPELTTIMPGEYLVLFADDSTEQGTLHVAFKLSEGGEEVGLFSTNGRLIDSLSYPKQYNNFSFGNLDLGFWMHVPPTPGEKNELETIAKLTINEFMSDNENRLMDEFGEFDDWIEIYNDNPFPVNLAGLYLSDSLSRPDRYRFPSNDFEKTVVPAMGYTIVWTDGNSAQGPLHTNFKLSREGEDLVLSAYDYHQAIDSVSFQKQYSNFSSGRLDDRGPWVDLPPTPGLSNISPDLSHLYLNEIMTMNMGIIADDYGEYDDWIELYNGGTEAIDLGGLFISDSIGDKKPFRISSDYPDSTTLEPSQFLLIWADDSVGQGVLHADFKLSRYGEQVAIYSYDGISLIDSVTYDLVHRYHTFGRSSDGHLPWAELTMPSPLKRNVLTGSVSTQADYLEASHGIYPNPASDHATISMEISSPTEVLVKVYDRSGKLVALPVDGFFNTGSYEIPWSLEDYNGSPLGDGMYFYIFESKERPVSGKLLIISGN